MTVNGGVTYNCNGNPQPALISAVLSLGTTSETFTVNHNPGLLPGTDLTVSGNITSGAGSGLTKAGMAR